MQTYHNLVYSTPMESRAETDKGWWFTYHRKRRKPKPCVYVDNISIIQQDNKQHVLCGIRMKKRREMNKVYEDETKRSKKDGIYAPN